MNRWALHLSFSRPIEASTDLDWLDWSQWLGERWSGAEFDSIFGLANTEAGNRWATHQAARLASEQLNEGSIEIGALHTDFYSDSVFKTFKS